MIGDDVTSALQGVWDLGVVPDSLLEGLIHLIPKGGCRNFISQCRPITLLGTCYKILAKAISLRLQPFLPNLIHDTRIGFVPGRSIFDNIFSFWEASKWAMQPECLKNEKHT